MTSLGPLFDQPTYPDAAGYARDSDTSRAAAAHVDETLSARQARVLSVLAERGPLAGFEVARVLRRPTYVVLPRLTELKLVGAVVDTGERRENPDTGRTATVWRAA